VAVVVESESESESEPEDELEVEEEEVSEAKEEVAKEGQKVYEAKNKDLIPYQLVRIKSELDFTTLLTFFEGLAEVSPEFYDGLNVVGCMHVQHDRVNSEFRKSKKNEDYFNQYKETKWAIASLHPAAVELLKNDSGYWGNIGSNDIAVKSYKLQDSNKPVENTVPHLYFSYPGLISEENATEQVHWKMQNMIECGWIAWDSYTIYNPPNSKRKGSKVNNFLLVVFHDEIPLTTRSAIKVLLDQTKFRGELDENYEEKYIQYMCIVSWVKESMMSMTKKQVAKPRSFRKPRIKNKDSEGFIKVSNRKKGKRVQRVKRRAVSPKPRNPKKSSSKGKPKPRPRGASPKVVIDSDSEEEEKPKPRTSVRPSPQARGASPKIEVDSDSEWETPQERTQEVRELELLKFQSDWTEEIKDDAFQEKLREADTLLKSKKSKITILQKEIELCNENIKQLHDDPEFGTSLDKEFYDHHDRKRENATQKKRILEKESLETCANFTKDQLARLKIQRQPKPRRSKPPLPRPQPRPRKTSPEEKKVEIESGSEEENIHISSSTRKSRVSVRPSPQARKPRPRQSSPKVVIESDSEEEKVKPRVSVRPSPQARKVKTKPRPRPSVNPSSQPLKVKPKPRPRARKPN
jgi:hypothetical protein